MTKGHVEDPLADELKVIIDMLRNQTGSDPVEIPSDKVGALLKIAEYEAEIVARAKYSRAVNLLYMRWRGLVIGVAAMITAISAITGSPIAQVVKSVFVGK